MGGWTNPSPFMGVRTAGVCVTSCEEAAGLGVLSPARGSEREGGPNRETACRLERHLCNPQPKSDMRLRTHAARTFVTALSDKVGLAGNHRFEIPPELANASNSSRLSLHTFS